jgi:hypothetical protein
MGGELVQQSRLFVGLCHLSPVAARFFEALGVSLEFLGELAELLIVDIDADYGFSVMREALAVVVSAGTDDRRLEARASASHLRARPAARPTSCVGSESDGGSLSRP